MVNAAAGTSAGRSGSTEFLLHMSLLNIFLDKHFYKESKRQMAGLEED
jgi:hypothetical protein